MIEPSDEPTIGLLCGPRSTPRCNGWTFASRTTASRSETVRPAAKGAGGGPSSQPTQRAGGRWGSGPHAAGRPSTAGAGPRDTRERPRPQWTRAPGLVGSARGQLVFICRLASVRTPRPGCCRSAGCARTSSLPGVAAPRTSALDWNISSATVRTCRRRLTARRGPS